MKKTLWLVVAAVIAIGGIAFLLADTSGIEAGTERAPARIDVAAEPMIPWREPQKDIDTFFPGAKIPDLTSPRILSLSRRRKEIIQRLGPETPLKNNALYIYDLLYHGHIVVRRVAGTNGAIEIVVAQHPALLIKDIRIQRHREPPEIAKKITSPAFLKSFEGLSTDADFEKSVPKGPAEESARAIAREVRATLIERLYGTEVVDRSKLLQ